jgi:3-methyladenine DNA glycosylase AlkD
MKGRTQKEAERLDLLQSLLERLQSLASGKTKNGMSRFGISTEKAYGISIPNLRQLAKQIGVNHELALELWETEIHEARILATMIDEPAKVTEKQMDSWVSDFNSWDLCDGACGNLFDRTPSRSRKPSNTVQGMKST